MVEAHYPLQALLYSVALHRYLRWRQPGYDPDVAPRRRALPVPARHVRSGRRGRRRRGAGRLLVAAAVRPRRRYVRPAGRAAMTDDAASAMPAGAAARPGCWRTSTGPGFSPPPTCTWRSGSARSAARPTTRCCSRSRWSCARRGTGRWCSTSSTAEATTSPDVDEEGAGAAEAPVELDWPDDWVARCAASPLVGGPLRHGRVRRLWLARYWDQEEQVAAELLERSAVPPDDLDPAVLRAGLDRLFGDRRDDDQRSAAAGLRAVAGQRAGRRAGHRQDDDGQPAAGPAAGAAPGVAGRAGGADRQGGGPAGGGGALVDGRAAGPADRDRVGELSATTLHRLLGWRPEARSRFRHDRTNRLPDEVVVVDEASMVSLTMMARLLEALRPSTRLVLVGDPDQLASVEAGAVLGDLVDASGHRVAVRGAARRNRRFPATSGIAPAGRAAGAGGSRRGRARGAAPRTTHPRSSWSRSPTTRVLSAEQLGGVRADVVRSGPALHEAAEAGDARAALARPGRAPAAVRAPARAARRDALERAGRAVGRRRAPGGAAGRRPVCRRAAAGDGERLRDRALQRRHRRGGGRRARRAGGGVRPRRRPDRSCRWCGSARCGRCTR